MVRTEFICQPLDWVSRAQAAPVGVPRDAPQQGGHRQGLAPALPEAGRSLGPADVVLRDQDGGGYYMLGNSPEAVTEPLYTFEEVCKLDDSKLVSVYLYQVPHCLQSQSPLDQAASQNFSEFGIFSFFISLYQNY